MTDFRSKLEQSYAEYFDSRYFQWSYEPEFLRVDGIFYQPDFWLPYAGGCGLVGLVVEVKGQMTPDDANKILQYAAVAGRDVFVGGDLDGSRWPWFYSRRSQRWFTREEMRAWNTPRELLSAIGHNWWTKLRCEGTLYGIKVDSTQYDVAAIQSLLPAPSTYVGDGVFVRLSSVEPCADVFFCLIEAVRAFGAPITEIWNEKEILAMDIDPASIQISDPEKWRKRAGWLGRLDR